MDDKSFYEKLIKNNGVSTQMMKALEEITELSEVIVKHYTKPEEFSGDNLRELIVKEMSHCLMTFESLKVIFNISKDEIEKEINLKKKLIGWNNKSGNDDVANKNFEDQEDFA